MTENEWLTGKEPAGMLLFIKQHRAMQREVKRRKQGDVVSKWLSDSRTIKRRPKNSKLQRRKQERSGWGKRPMVPDLPASESVRKMSTDYKCLPSLSRLLPDHCQMGTLAVMMTPCSAIAEAFVQPKRWNSVN